MIITEVYVPFICTNHMKIFLFLELIVQKYKIKKINTIWLFTF